MKKTSFILLFTIILISHSFDQNSLSCVFFFHIPCMFYFGRYINMKNNCSSGKYLGSEVEGRTSTNSFKAEVIEFQFKEAKRLCLKTDLEKLESIVDIDYKLRFLRNLVHGFWKRLHPLISWHSLDRMTPLILTCSNHLFYKTKICVEIYRQFFSEQLFYVSNTKLTLEQIKDL